MARLTNNDRDRIVRAMRPEIQSKVKEIKKNLSKIFNEVIMREIPEEVFVFAGKYPQLFTEGDTVYINGSKYSIYISVAKHPVRYFKDFLKVAKTGPKGDEVKELLKSLELEFDKAKIIENKISCALNNISTEKKLKDEFPEAFAVYITLNAKVGEQSSNSCDNIENIRAQLNALKKKE